METILDELYDYYNRFVPKSEWLEEIESAHQALIRSLEKPERKLVLRIIDNKNLISDAYAKESFDCGFWLAWRLLSQLHSYDNGRPLEEILNVGDRFAMPKGEIEHDPQT